MALPIAQRLQYSDFFVRRAGASAGGGRMETLCESEFADEYQDWLSGHPGALGSARFDVPVAQLDCHDSCEVTPNTPLREVIALMSERASTAVLVVRNERLLGVFSERDLLRGLGRGGLDLEHASVGALTGPCPDVLSETTTLAQALRTMLRSKLAHLPIVDADGRALGLVSMHDIIEFVSDAFPKEILNAPPERQSLVPALDGA
jgi:CBS domain-containing protein